jgi:aspartyl protease family protein
MKPSRWTIPRLITTRLLAALVTAAALVAPVNARAEALDAALRRLAEAHGFAIEGLDRVRDAEARDARGDLLDRIEAMLADFNHTIVRTPDGGIARLAILGRKRHVAPPPDNVAVATFRRGRHHVVEAVIRGNGAGTLTLPLIVDTGASMVVLPASMMATLGFRAGDLEVVAMQTANRTVQGRVGMLRSVAVGGMAASDVHVAFIDDPLLDGAMLLGMSYLSRFRLTIDDTKNQILLTRTR